MNDGDVCKVASGFAWVRIFDTTLSLNDNFLKGNLTLDQNYQYAKRINANFKAFLSVT